MQFQVRSTFCVQQIGMRARRLGGAKRHRVGYGAEASSRRAGRRHSGTRRRGGRTARAALVKGVAAAVDGDRRDNTNSSPQNFSRTGKKIIGEKYTNLTGVCSPSLMQPFEEGPDVSGGRSCRSLGLIGCGGGVQDDV
jgi:hypothetical protein